MKAISVWLEEMNKELQYAQQQVERCIKANDISLEEVEKTSEWLANATFYNRLILNRLVDDYELTQLRKITVGISSDKIRVERCEENADNFTVYVNDDVFSSELNYDAAWKQLKCLCAGYKAGKE